MNWIIKSFVFCCILSVYSCSKNESEPNPEPRLTGTIIFSQGDTTIPLAVIMYDVENDSLWSASPKHPGIFPSSYDLPKFMFDKSGYFVTAIIDENISTLYHVDTKNNNTKNVLSSTSFPLNGCPSPDGKQLVLCHRGSNDQNQLFLADISGSNERQLTNFPRTARRLFVDNLCWSMDGTILFSYSLDTIRTNVYSINPANGEQKKITNNTKSALFFTSVSPDGKKILYTLALRTGLEIFSMNVDGTDSRQITNFGERAHSAAWSPDGNFIAFKSDFEDPSDPQFEHLYIMKSDGTLVKKIKEKFGAGLGIDWK